MHIHVRICYYSDQSANSISNRGDYSRAASISFVLAQVRVLFKSGVYLRAVSIRSYTVHVVHHEHRTITAVHGMLHLRLQEEEGL